MLPSSLGLPQKFESFRSYPGYDQWRTIKQIFTLFQRGKRFVILNGPPGVGKSLIYWVTQLLLQSVHPSPSSYSLPNASSLLSGSSPAASSSSPLRPTHRSLFLTGSRVLQSQLSNDFSSLAIVKGRSNYACYEYNGTCDLPAVSESRCSLERPPDGGTISCPYRLAINEAYDNDTCNGNYAFWMSLARYGDPNSIGQFDFLVGDEAHNILDILADFCAIEFSLSYVQSIIGNMDGSDDVNVPVPKQSELNIAVWSRWASSILSIITRRLSSIPKSDRWQRAKLTKLRTSLSQLAAMSDDTKELSRWAIDNRTPLPSSSSIRTRDRNSKPDRMVKISPIWPGRFAEQYLFRNIPHILLCSASISPQLLTDLDIPPDQSEYIEVTSAFPSKNRPVVYLNMIPQLKVQHDISEGERIVLSRRIDQIIKVWGKDARLKGIIHSNSYEWTEWICRNSRYKDEGLIITHGRGKAREAVEKFKRAKSGVLISPAIWEGHDFIGELCEWAVLLKIPWLDSRSPIIAARKKQRKGYADSLIASKILQGSMRHIRSEKDRGPFFILDWHWSHFRKTGKEKRYFPVYFSNAFKEYDHVPTPEELFGK